MHYYLSLGSNLGDRETTLRKALQQIEQQIGHVTRCSSFFYSEPWGFESPNSFCNLCCAVETTMQPMDVLNATQAIERALGRNHKSVEGQYSDRPIDIDIIRAFDDEQKEIVSNSPLLTIPHPLYQQRPFVLIPLQEISGE
jgi:2-amino-4-hydroxy-6-hydroxymethyldihydropteridine diphosphokinase